MVFKQGKNKELMQIFINEMKRKLRLYPDIMLKYSVYDSVEATIKNYTYQDWDDMRKQLIRNNEKLLGRD